MPAIRRRKRKGGVVPLATVVPALVAVGKTAALAALGTAVGHQTKKWLDHEEKKYKKSKRTKNIR